VAGAGPGLAAAAQRPSPFGAGCGTGAGGPGAGGGFGGGANTAGPFVLPGTYTVSLIVDGKTVDAKPLKVGVDPEVALTGVERKRMFDMAMEMHALQRQGQDVSAAIRPLNTRLGEIVKELESRTDVPAEVKASAQALAKDVAAFAPRFAQAAGRGGGGGAGAGQSTAAPRATPAPPLVNLLTIIGQTKTGLMATMPVTGQAAKAYADSKAQVPKAIAEANALIARAGALGGELAPFKVTLAAPGPVK